MPIIGQLIKTAIEVKERFASKESPAEIQQEILKELLEKAADTSFGKYYNFSGILKEKDVEATFKKELPFFDYNSMYEKWWKRSLMDLPDITWPGVMNYYALSSGTTGDQSKKIPVSDEMLDAIRGHCHRSNNGHGQLQSTIRFF